MGKHTQNCTLIGKGVYGTIGVDQRSRLADGAHFHTMIVTSTLEASVIEGDKLVLNGVLKGHDVNSRALEVHPLRSTMFSRFDMDGYEDGSTVRHITAVTVEANHLQCRTLTADSAMLRNGSAVESATCATALGIDRTSSVLLVNGDCQRIHLKTA